MDRDQPEVVGCHDQVVFRYASYDTPLWARNNTGNGRWHVTGDGATQHLALHPDAAWADLIRRENLRTEGEVELVRMKMWALSLTLNGLVDYSSFDKAEAAGFPPDALVDDDQTRCQLEGNRLRTQGFHGVVAPRNALPGATRMRQSPGAARDRPGVHQARLSSAIPCCLVAVGSPPAGLLGRVRHDPGCASGPIVEWPASDHPAIDVGARRRDRRGQKHGRLHR